MGFFLGGGETVCMCLLPSPTPSDACGVDSLPSVVQFGKPDGLQSGYCTWEVPPTPVIHYCGCHMYVVGSRSFRADQLVKVTEIKQLCYFSA